MGDKSKSLRTTVPPAVVQALKAGPGWTLIWTLVPETGGFSVMVSSKRKRPSRV